MRVGPTVHRAGAVLTVGFGVLTVAATARYLQQYGGWDLRAARPELMGLVLLLLGTFLALAVALLRPRPSNPRGAQRTAIVWSLALLAALAVYRKSDRRPLSHLAHQGQPVTYDRFTERFGVPSAVIETMIFAVAGVVLFLAYIGLFGQYFYPTLPEQLGGGRPRMAQILVSGDAVPAVRELGLDVNGVRVVMEVALR